MAYNILKGVVEGSVDQYADQEIDGVKVFKNTISASVFYDTDAQSPCATMKDVAITRLKLFATILRAPQPAYTASLLISLQARLKQMLLKYRTVLLIFAAQCKLKHTTVLLVPIPALVLVCRQIAAYPSGPRSW